jgi:hypothetical protein
MASKITFSTRPFTLGELELAGRITANNDITAVIDLMVLRSDRPIIREYVCSLSESEAMEAIAELGKSMRQAVFLRNLLGGISNEPPDHQPES